MFSPDVGIGDWIFEDLNGDGSLSTAIYPDGDHVVLADEDPRYEFGINFNAAYRGFDFTMFCKEFYNNTICLMVRLLKVRITRTLFTRRWSRNVIILNLIRMVRGQE